MRKVIDRINYDLFGSRYDLPKVGKFAPTMEIGTSISTDEFETRRILTADLHLTVSYSIDGNASFSNNALVEQAKRAMAAHIVEYLYGDMRLALYAIREAVHLGHLHKALSLIDDLEDEIKLNG